MVNFEKYDDLIVGSGIAGKSTAWTRIAVVERPIVVREPL
jgi:hypothetical protein